MIKKSLIDFSYKKSTTRNKLADYQPWELVISANIISCLSEIVKV